MEAKRAETKHGGEAETKVFPSSEGEATHTFAFTQGMCRRGSTEAHGRGDSVQLRNGEDAGSGSPGDLLRLQTARGDTGYNV